MKPKITLVDGDDWQGLYVNGELVTQGHSIRAQDVCEVLGADYAFVSADYEWLDERGALPELLKDVKRIKHNG